MAIGRLPISAYCLVKRVTAKTQYGSCRGRQKREIGGEGKRERVRVTERHAQREIEREKARERTGSAIGRDLCVEIT